MANEQPPLMTVWINQIIRPRSFIPLSCLRRMKPVCLGMFTHLPVKSRYFARNVPQTARPCNIFLGGEFFDLRPSRRWYASMISAPINKSREQDSSWLGQKRQTHKKSWGPVQGETMDDRSFGYAPGPFIRKKKKKKNSSGGSSSVSLIRADTKGGGY